MVCGSLVPFHPGGTIARALNPSSPDSEPPSLARRIQWANQMASAIHHLHRVAYTYHEDIKLDNVVLSTDDDAVFIDFEQARHAEGCLILEAQGSWDVIFLLPRVTPIPQLLFAMSPSKIRSIVERCLLEDPVTRPRLDLILTELKYCSF